MATDDDDDSEERKRVYSSWSELLLVPQINLITIISTIRKGVILIWFAFVLLLDESVAIISTRLFSLIHSFRLTISTNSWLKNDSETFIRSKIEGFSSRFIFLVGISLFFFFHSKNVEWITRKPKFFWFNELNYESRVNKICVSLTR